jgi:hypothetical protein
MARPHKVYAKTIQIHAGLELIGSKMSLSHKQNDMEVTPIGIRVLSKKTKRTVIIPWGNIKGAELLPNLAQDVEDELNSD